MIKIYQKNHAKKLNKLNYVKGQERPISSFIPNRLAQTRGHRK